MRPSRPAGALPALIYFHGGGFVAGALESHDGLCRLFAAEGGFKVIAVDYRLAPENPCPAAVDDAWAATPWIEQNAAQLGIDAGRIAVGGDSAGGMLAAIVTQMAREKGGLKLACQLLMFPNTQIGGETVLDERIRRGLFPGTPRHRIFQFALSAAGRRQEFAARLAAAGQGLCRPAAGLCDAGRL